MNNDALQRYTKEFNIPIKALKLMNEKLKISEKKISSIAASRRLEFVKEAINWKKGDDQKTRIITKLYFINEYVVAVGKPGKEADPEYRRYNPNDMNPQILKLEEKISKDFTFIELFEMIERLKHKDIFGLELLGTLLFRMAFMLDHKKNEEGNWRYCPPEEILQIIEERIPMVSEFPIRVFIYFLDILSLNEDIKVYTREQNKELKEKYGRTNTLLTFVHLISVFLELETIAKFAGGFARFPRGMSPIPIRIAYEYFPLLIPNFFNF